MQNTESIPTHQLANSVAVKALLTVLLVSIYARCQELSHTEVTQQIKQPEVLQLFLADSHFEQWMAKDMLHRCTRVCKGANAQMPAKMASPQTWLDNDCWCCTAAASPDCLVSGGGADSLVFCCNCS